MSETSETDEASRADLQKLQGEWRTTSVEVDGTPVASWLFENARLIITADRFVLRNPLPDSAQNIEGTLKLDAAAVPKRLTLVLDDGRRQWKTPLYKPGSKVISYESST